MNIIYSNKLLQLILEIKKNQQPNTSVLIVLINRFKISSLVIFQCVFYWFKGQNVTIITGDTIRFGSGSFELLELKLANLIPSLWQSKLNIEYIKPDHQGVSFRDLLKQELKVTENDTIEFILTTHNILLIKYQINQCFMMTKVALTDAAKVYLQRQVVGLKKHQYLAALHAINLESPKLLNEGSVGDATLLIQSYIPGNTLPRSGSNAENIEHIEHNFNICADVAAKMNKQLTCDDQKWQAYSDFKLLPQHYLKHSEQLTLIIQYLLNFLISSDRHSVHIHGDYHFGNIIFDSSKTQVKGMIDFDRASAGGTDLHDTMMLFLAMFTANPNGKNMYYGEVINRLLQDNDDRLAFKRFLNDICLKFDYSLVDVKCMAIIVWLFLLQSAMREKATVSRNWHTWMLDNTVPVVYEFCNNLIQTQGKQNPIQ